MCELIYGRSLPEKFHGNRNQFFHFECENVPFFFFYFFSQTTTTTTSTTTNAFKRLPSSEASIPVNPLRRENVIIIVFHLMIAFIFKSIYETVNQVVQIELKICLMLTFQCQLTNENDNKIFKESI